MDPAQVSKLNGKYASTQRVLNPVYAVARQSAVIAVRAGDHLRSVRSNISASGATDCAFAENTFYEYWVNHGASSFSVYSPADQTSYTVSCSADGDIVCTTDQGGSVTFAQSAIDAYTQTDASRSASSHDVG